MVCQNIVNCDNNGDKSRKELLLKRRRETSFDLALNCKIAVQTFIFACMFLGKKTMKIYLLKYLWQMDYYFFSGHFGHESSLRIIIDRKLSSVIFKSRRETWKHHDIALSRS